MTVSEKSSESFRGSESGRMGRLCRCTLTDDIQHPLTASESNPSSNKVQIVSHSTKPYTMKRHVVISRLLMTLLCVFQIHVVEALIGRRSEGLLSRIQTAQCELLVSIGRIPGTAMPSEWAASGAKLGFPLEIEFTDEEYSTYEMTKERLLTGDIRNFRSVVPLNVPTFISRKGQETIKVLPGAYSCELQSLEAQQYTVRFFLDFPEGAIRNDVELPAERIYFLSSCWIKDDRVLERATKRKEEIMTSLKGITTELQQLATENTSMIQKALSLRRTVILVEKRTKLEGQLAELEQTYPLLSPERFVEGPKNLLFVKDGIVAVKRFRGAMETREQYWWIGTFQFNEFFDEEEYEDDPE